MTNWTAITRQLLAEMEAADPVWRPTNFWEPGVERVLDDLERVGLESFKRWPSRGWFNPRYGRGLDYAMMDEAHAVLEARGRRDLTKEWFRGQLSGSADARRDFDVARIAWDQHRWPFDIEGYGESDHGQPIQRFGLIPGSSLRWGRPYLNYLLLLAALSRHVDAPPTSFLEVGGGYGTLGELVMTRDPSARYVDVDIPPLLVVAAYYLSQIEPAARLPNELGVGSIAASRACAVPTWRLTDIEGPFDVFVNSYSFQEMEPNVVTNYVDTVSQIGAKWIVSLNSKEGKRRASGDRRGGAIEPVTSAFIADQFEALGYRIVGRYGREFIGPTTAELLVLTNNS